MPIWKIRKTDQTTKCYFPYTRRKDSRDHRNGTLPHSRPDEMNNHVAVGGGGISTLADRMAHSSVTSSGNAATVVVVNARNRPGLVG